MEALSSQQKTAEALLALAPQDAANVLKTLDERELFYVGDAILHNARRTSNNPVESITRIVQGNSAVSKNSEFATNINGNNLGISAVKFSTDTRKARTSNAQSFLKLAASDFSELEVVKALYRIAFGRKRAKELISKLLHRNLRNRLSFLNNYSVAHLFEAVEKESLQIISVVLSILKPNTSAKLLSKFNEQTRNEIILRISNQQIPHESVLSILEESLKRTLNDISLAEQETEKPDGEKNLVEILAYLDFQAQEAILEELEDRELKERVLYKLFAWKDVESLSQKEIESILAQYSSEDLAKLMLLDGIDARKTLDLVVSKNRMLVIEDELEKINIDFSTQVQAAKDAAVLKKQFFDKVRQLMSLTTN